MNPLQKILDRESMSKIFMNFTVIANVSKDFLDLLQEKYPMKAIENYVPIFKIYSDYCNGY